MCADMQRLSPWERVVALNSFTLKNFEGSLERKKSLIQLLCMPHKSGLLSLLHFLYSLLPNTDFHFDCMNSFKREKIDEIFEVDKVGVSERGGMSATLPLLEI